MVQFAAFPDMRDMVERRFSLPFGVGCLMRLPYSWLREVVAVAPGWDIPGELERICASAGRRVMVGGRPGDRGAGESRYRGVATRSLRGEYRRSYRELFVVQFRGLVVVCPGATLPGGFTVAPARPGVLSDDSHWQPGSIWRRPFRDLVLPGWS